MNRKAHPADDSRYDELRRSLYDTILQETDLTEIPDDAELQEIIRRAVRDAGRNNAVSLREQMLLGKALFNSFRRLDLIQELLEDPEITEIMINGPNRIFIEKKGKVRQIDQHFQSLEKLENIIQQIAAGSNRMVNEFSPIVDARLEDGSRVNIVLPPASLDGLAVTIRKFPGHPMTMKELIRAGSLTEEAAEFMRDIVAYRCNVFISGGTGAGKTTFLAALTEYIPQEERIITIEDNAELQLVDVPNLIRLEARNKNTEGTGEITIRDLIRTSLRMRPDRIVVGEVRSGEALDMLVAMNTGHDGSISTGHANSPRDMLSRLEMMVLMGMELPLDAVRRQISSGLDILIHLGRLRDGSRKVMEIVELCGYCDGEILLNSLYRFERGELRRIGKVQTIQKLDKG